MPDRLLVIRLAVGYLLLTSNPDWPCFKPEVFSPFLNACLRVDAPGTEDKEFPLIVRGFFRNHRSPFVTGVKTVVARRDLPWYYNGESSIYHYNTSPQW